MLYQKSGWIVLLTQSHKEYFAAENLVRQNFKAYCPSIVKHIRHARKAFDAPRPLFPGYIFAEHEPEPGRLRSLLGTYGVRSVIRNGQLPALLPEGFIEELKAREVDGVIAKPETPFARGNQVCITGGPFDGLIGQIVEVREHDRILLLLDLLHQPTRVQISANRLCLA